MKRLHIHVAVNDLAASTRFYSALFGTEPTVSKEDYAKWLLDDPRVNFAISARGRTPGLDHLGIQVEDDAELAAAFINLQRADAPILDQGETVCCYARSDKAWIHDPQGIAWETFLTRGEATTYGSDAATDSASTACCAPPVAPVTFVKHPATSTPTTNCC